VTGPVREADPADLVGWDRRTVDVAGGQVFQSRAWAIHRAATGSHAHHLVFDDGRAVLALRRPWPLVGGSQAYLPRGPVTAGDEPGRVAERLDSVAAWLAGRGVDVVTTDAEVPAASGYGERLHELGFRPVDEIQAARHRLSLPIAGLSEDQLFAGIARQTRQRIRQAEEGGIVVVRYDALAAAGAGQGFVAGDAAQLPAALSAFHGLVLATGERRGFRLGPIGPFLAWLTAAHAAGLAIYLEARAPDGAAAPDDGPGLPGAPLASLPLAGLLLYRQGDRLSTAISGDDAGWRAAQPGLLHLLRWRAIQLAVRERRGEMDLGGVDIAGARGEPRPGEPMYGLYQHKRSFGAAWVEQVGAHARPLRPVHLMVARAAARVAQGLRR